MPKYVIEREIPGAGKLSREELQAISQKSCGELIREHARQGGFPANRISEVRAIIDPTTAESKAR
jgi:hypothetical protein